MVNRKESEFNVLVVDDHPQTAVGIATILDNEGFKTFEAYNRDDAIEICEEKKIDLVIIDEKTELGECLKEKKILITSYEEVPKEKIKRLKNLAGIVKKPVDAEELLPVVRKVLRL